MRDREGKFSPSVKKLLFVNLGLVMCVIFAVLYYERFSLGPYAESGIGGSIPESTDVRRRNKLYFDYVDAIERLNAVIKVKKKKRLPDVIGIGVKKCGTGALRSMLLRHPMIISSPPHEKHYFDQLIQTQDIEYYKEMMPEAASYEVVIEKTPAYFNFGPMNIPELIKKNVPDAKIVLVLCDPVNRTFSDFVHEVHRNNIRNGTQYAGLMHELVSSLFYELDVEKLEDEEISYRTYKLKNTLAYSYLLTTGLYYYHLVRWFKSFNKSEIHIIDGEQLIKQPWEVIDKLQDFLNIPKLLIKNDFLRDPNTGFYCPAKPYIAETKNGKMVVNQKPKCMQSSVKGRTRLGASSNDADAMITNLLRRFFAPYNEKLYKLLGRRFEWQ